MPQHQDERGTLVYSTNSTFILRMTIESHEQAKKPPIGTQKVARFARNNHSLVEVAMRS